MAEARIDLKVYGSAAIKEATKNILDLGVANERLDKIYDSVAAAEARRIKEVDKLSALQKRLAKEVEAGTMSEQRANRVMDQAVRGALEKIHTDQRLIKQEKEKRKEAERNERLAAKEVETNNRLRAQYDQIYAAKVRLNQAQEELNRAVAAGMSKELASQRLEELTKDYQAWIAAVESGNYAMINSGNQFARFNDSVFRAQQRMKRFASVGLQQAGYQIQDFIVQVSAGQSALVAFGQQGSQLAGILGPKGAIIGAAIAGISALAMVIKAFNTEAKEAKEKAEQLASYMEKLTDSIKDYGDAKEAAAQGITVEQLLGVRNVDDLKAKIDSITESLDKRNMAILAGQVAGAGVNTGFIYGTVMGMMTGDTSGQREEDIATLTKLLVALNERNLQLAEEQYRAFSELFIARKQEMALAAKIAEYGEDSVQVEQLRKQQALENFKREIKQKIESAEITKAQGDELVRQFQEEQKLTAEQEKQIAYRKQLEDQNEAMLKNIEEAKELEAERKREAEELKKELAEQEAEISRNHEAYIPLVTAQREFAEGVNQSITNFENLLSQVEKTKEDLGTARAEALRLAGVDMAKPISEAAAAASVLMVNMGVSLEKALQIAALQSSMQYGGRGGDTEFNTRRGAMTVADRSSPMGKMVSDILNPPKKRDGGGQSKSFSSYMESLEKELELKNRLVGMTEEQKTSAQRYFDIEQKALDIIARKEGKLRDLTPVEEERIKKLVEEEAALRRVTEAEQKRKSMMETIEGHITDAFMTMIDGSSSVENAFKGMLRNILMEIYKQKVAEPIAEGIGGFIGKIFGFSNGGAFIGGRVIPFANGGVVSGPTIFPMSGSTGLMGEAGPEAIMPLKRGPNGKLGVEASGGQQVIVNQNFHFSANGDESVKKIIAQAAPQIAQMTQKQIMDSRRRGGQMKAAFS